MRKLHSQFFVLSVGLTRSDTISPVKGEITRLKTYNFRIKSGIYKRYICQVFTDVYNTFIYCYNNICLCLTFLK